MAYWLSEKLLEIYERNWSGIPVTPVPPRRARIFHSGVDLVDEIASCMEKKGIQVLRLLRRRGNRTQKALNRLERLQASALKYELKSKAKIAHNEIIVLDDVSTTGSTLNTCARVLKSGGVERVYGLAVCKD